MTRLSAGDPAPTFAMTADDGSEVSSESLAGSRYVLYFYPKDDTPGCTTQACGLRDSWSRVADTGVEVFGVSPDSVKSHAKFREKYALPYRLLSDDGPRRGRGLRRLGREELRRAAPTSATSAPPSSSGPMGASSTSWPRSSPPSTSTSCSRRSPREGRAGRWSPRASRRLGPAPRGARRSSPSSSCSTRSRDLGRHRRRARAVARRRAPAPRAVGEPLPPRLRPSCSCTR